MPPVQNPNGPEMAQWLLNYGNSGGTIAAPVPATPTESRAYPIGKVGTDTKQTQPETKQSEPKGTPAESRAVPVGEDAAMFLMRPAGLSGPDGKREAPVKLTNYEGLADNAKARRLTWEEYNALTPEEQDIADLNKLLVRSREADLTRDRKLKPAQMAQYTADVAAIFGPDGGSKVVAPKTVDLLKSIDFKGVGQDLDDFLSLNKGITVDEVKAGNLVDKGLVDSVQATAETAFAKPDQQYWNLNSAVRGITPEEAKKKNLPGGFGLEVRKVNEPETDAQGKIRWTQDRVYNEVWNGLKSGREEYNPKKLKEFFKFLEFDEKDFKELRDNIHLRAMNEKLYGTAPAAAQSVDGKQVTERTGEEVLQFLEGLM
jgi:hypothetical protein